MTEDRNTKKFTSSASQSRRKARKRKRILKVILLCLMTLALGLGLGFGARAIMGRSAGKRAERESSIAASLEESRRAAQSSAAASSSQSSSVPAGSTAAQKTTEVPSSVPQVTTEAETQTEEAPSLPTEAPTQPTEAPTEPGPSGDFHLYTAEELLPVPGEVGRDTLSEGGWYGGKFVRDLSTGSVVCEWDRAYALQDMLEYYGAIYHKNKEERVAYLTFDCGGTSDADMVNEVLDILQEKNVKAIFFIPGEFFLSPLNRAGESIRQDRVEVMRRILREGHLIGSHTYTHPTMCNLSDEDFIDQLNTLQLRLNSALGYDLQLSYYRPPEGACSERDLYLAEKMGYHVTLWSFAYGDYNVNNQPDPEASLEKMKVGLHDGCVYLLHACSSTNRAVLGDLIDFMKDEGYDVRRIDK